MSKTQLFAPNLLYLITVTDDKLGVLYSQVHAATGYAHAEAMACKLSGTYRGSTGLSNWRIQLYPPSIFMNGVIVRSAV